MLDHVFHFFDPIKQFFAEKSGHLPEKLMKIIPKLEENDWIEKVGFLTDITGHLNNLNKQLQGENKFVCDMIGHMTAFESKLKLFQMQLKAHDCVNFEKFQFLKKKSNLNNYDLFSTCTENLLFCMVSGRGVLMGGAVPPIFLEPDTLSVYCIRFLFQMSILKLIYFKIPIRIHFILYHLRIYSLIH